MFKIKFHSIVDVITNSSTVIYTYQNSIEQSKELIQEILNLMGEDLTPDDIFYYGVFCDNDRYEDYICDYEDEDEEEFEKWYNSEERFSIKNMPKVNWSDPEEERNKQRAEKTKWFNDLKLAIIKNEMEKPEWMESAEDGGDYWDPDTYLYLHTKDKRFDNLASKISNLLNSVTADGGHNG